MKGKLQLQNNRLFVVVFERGKTEATPFIEFIAVGDKDSVGN